jgi:hypothetical protein
MGGIFGAIEGVVGGITGDFGGGGDFLSELMDAFEGSAAGSAGGNNSSGGNNTVSEIGQIASDVLPIVAAFL